MTTPDLLEDVGLALKGHGLMLRGGFHPETSDHLGADVATVLLVGNAGSTMWTAFEHASAVGTDPLDRWTRDVVDRVATKFSMTAIFPFDGPPYWPFQSWALRSDEVHVSPIGVLIHPDFGLWHAYRAALLSTLPIVLPPVPRGPSPCEACSAKPCLSSCPVDAFDNRGYDVPSCTVHLRSGRGSDCMSRGCLARRACPVGRGSRYPDEQSAFHMAAFERAR